MSRIAKLRDSLGLTAAAAMLCVPVSASADTTVNAKLVEQNGSGVSGKVTLTALDNGGLKVVIRSQGLVPDQPHAQHIHGSAHGGHFGCPTVEKNDKDGDGVLTNEEATGEYGTVFVALTTEGGTTPQDGLDVKRMPVADAEGRVNYERTLTADTVPEGLVKHLSTVHVVQHGIDHNNNGEYDLDALGVSTFAESLGAKDVPEEATNPASCGVVQGAGMSGKPRGGVETGGAPAPELNAPLTAAGAGLLLLSAGFAVSAVTRSRRNRTADEAKTPA